MSSVRVHNADLEKVKIATGASTISFTDAASRGTFSNAVKEFVAPALDNQHTSIGDLGIRSVHHTHLAPAGGPGYGNILEKSANNYYGGILYGYRIANDGLIFYDFNGGVFRLYSALFPGQTVTAADEQLGGPEIFDNPAYFVGG